MTDWKRLTGPFAGDRIGRLLADMIADHARKLEGEVSAAKRDLLRAKIENLRYDLGRHARSATA